MPARSLALPNRSRSQCPQAHRYSTRPLGLPRQRTSNAWTRAGDFVPESYLSDRRRSQLNPIGGLDATGHARAIGRSGTHLEGPRNLRCSLRNHFLLERRRIAPTLGVRSPLPFRSGSTQQRRGKRERSCYHRLERCLRPDADHGPRVPHVDIDRVEHRQQQPSALTNVGPSPKTSGAERDNHRIATTLPNRRCRDAGSRRTLSYPLPPGTGIR